LRVEPRNSACQSCQEQSQIISNKTSRPSRPSTTFPRQITIGRTARLATKATRDETRRDETRRDEHSSVSDASPPPPTFPRQSEFRPARTSNPRRGFIRVAHFQSASRIHPRRALPIRVARFQSASRASNPRRALPIRVARFQSASRGFIRGARSATRAAASRSISLVALSGVRAEWRSRSAAFALSGVRAQRRSRSAAFALSGVRAQRRSRAVASRTVASRAFSRSPIRDAEGFDGTRRAARPSRTSPRQSKFQRRSRAAARAACSVHAAPPLSPQFAE
jgi:hypothetical protein